MKAKPDNLFTDRNGEVPQDVLLRYAGGIASPEESRWVEEKMADDPFLSDAVEGMMKIKNPDKAQQDLNVIHELIRKKAGVKQRTISLQNRWLQLAAALVILISGVWFINNSLNKSSEKIFTNEFQPYPPPELNEPTVPSDPLVRDEKQSISMDSIPPSKYKAVGNEKAPAAIEKSMNAESVKTEDVQSVADQQDNANDVTQAEALTEVDNAKESVVFDSKKSVSDNTVVMPSAKTPAGSEQFVQQPASTLSKAEGIKNANEKGADYEIAKQQQSDEIKSDLNLALEYYHAANYPEAINGFEKVLQQDPDNDAANFYAGVSYLAVDDADEALNKLKNLDNKRNGVYFEATLWYESLAYIQKGEKKSAAGILEKVVKLNGEYRSKAEMLLQKL